MGKDPSVFKQDNVKFVPTLIIYENGEEILRIESGINLELPQDTKKELQKKLDELLENKF